MRLLIVSPHFPPTNAADMQRVRLLLPHLAEAGIRAEVLAVEPEQVAAPRDPWLAQGLPADVPVHRVKALGLKWSRMPGLGTLSFRALGAIRSRGNGLLGRGQLSEVGGRMSEVGGRKSEMADSRRPPPVSRSAFDLVYFSTTQFGIHVLGPEWKRKFKVPFVIDYQDPWVNDYYREHPEVTPPGGRLKHALASAMARRQEPRVLRQCSGITSVSAAYPKQLQTRYPWLNMEEVGGRKSEIGGQGSEFESTNHQAPTTRHEAPATQHQKQSTKHQTPSTRHQAPSPKHKIPNTLPFIVLPFPGDLMDMERVRDSDIRQTVFDPKDGKKHWVYIGRGGADMALAVRAIFAAVAHPRPLTPDTCLPSPDIRLHFIGTSYAAAGKGVKTIEALAAAYGLEEIVSEHPDRIPYSETLRALLDADALIVPGSNDPGYTASKIYPYLLAGKPLLAVFHERSSVVDLIRSVGGGNVIGFESGETPESIGQRIRGSAMTPDGQIREVALDAARFSPHTARLQARILQGFFEGCLASEDPMIHST